jgi:hypothetical protein
MAGGASSFTGALCFPLLVPREAGECPISPAFFVLSPVPID